MTDRITGTPAAIVCTSSIRCSLKLVPDIQELLRIPFSDVEDPGRLDNDSLEFVR